MRSYSYEINRRANAPDVTITLECQNPNYASREELKQLNVATRVRKTAATRSSWDVPAQAHVYTVAAFADLIEGGVSGKVFYKLTVSQGARVIHADDYTTNDVEEQAQQYPGSATAVFYGAQIMLY